MSPEQHIPGAPVGGGVPDAATVAGWTEPERDEVARLLAAARTATSRRDTRTLRPFVLLVGAGGALVLLPWIAYLTATLPTTTNVGAWRVAWVGYDIGLVVVLAAVAWLAYRRRQLVTIGLAVAGTLLSVDVWFDVTLSWNTSGHLLSLVTAALVELPVSAFLLAAALRTLRGAIATVAALRGRPIGPFSLWRAPIVMRGSPAPVDSTPQGGPPTG